MQNSTNSFVKVIIFYTALVIVVLVWSGHKRETTVFDKYLINLEGVALSVSSIEESRLFYEKLLELKLSRIANSSAEYYFPDGKVLQLSQCESTAEINTSVVDDLKNSCKLGNQLIFIRVKNGITKLHRRLESRLKSQVYSSKARPSITAISKHSGVRSFSAIDIDGNRIEFAQTGIFTSR